MNNKMGYIIIVIGIALVVWGIVLVRKAQKTEILVTSNVQPVSVETKPAIPDTDENKEPSKVDTKVTEKVQKDDYEENKAKGDAFEKFVVKNFSRKYFTLLEWRSDKYVDGIYAVSNHFPDLEVVFDFKAKGVKEVFAIECKWRKNFYNEGIEWAYDYQIKNYKEYANKLKIPVFVVIGVGGEPDKPEELFIVPLPNMKTNVISKMELVKYQKDISDPRFFWDYEKSNLR